MSEFEGRVQTVLDAALEAAFSHVKHGGDHESRRLIAARLLEAARSGVTALDELKAIGRRALIDLGPGDGAAGPVPGLDGRPRH